MSATVLVSNITIIKIIQIYNLFCSGICECKDHPAKQRQRLRRSLKDELFFCVGGGQMEIYKD